MGAGYTRQGESISDYTVLSVFLLRLTPRERQITRLVARGCPDKEIAVLVGISYHTVRTHLRNIYERHGLGGRGELAAAWRKAPGGGRPREKSAKRTAKRRVVSPLSASGRRRSATAAFLERSK